MRKKKKRRRRLKRHHRTRSATSSDSTSTSDQDSSSSKSRKVKSGAFRKYSDRVSVRFKWPNEFIGRHDGTCPTYDNMTFSELIFGTFSGLLEQLPRLHENRFIIDQLHYYRELFRDGTTSSLADTKNCHRRVLEALEKGEISPTNWLE